MDIKSIFSILLKDFALEKISNRGQTELVYTNPYTLLVAVVLSAQATDKSVNKIVPDLFKIIQTPEDMIKLGEEKLKGYIKSINLYNTKAKNIIALSHKLIDNFQSRIPNTREDLMSLNGVGRKTANIILNIVYNIPSIAVDTHVFRVANRIGLTNKSTNVLNTEIILDKIIPDEYKIITNHCLVLLGRYICQARKPKCDSCPIAHLCQKNL